MRSARARCGTPVDGRARPDPAGFRERGRRATNASHHSTNSREIVPLYIDGELEGALSIPRGSRPRVPTFEELA